MWCLQALQSTLCRRGRIAATPRSTDLLPMRLVVLTWRFPRWVSTPSAQKTDRVARQYCTTTSPLRRYPGLRRLRYRLLSIHLRLRALRRRHLPMFKSSFSRAKRDRLWREPHLPCTRTKQSKFNLEVLNPCLRVLKYTGSRKAPHAPRGRLEAPTADLSMPSASSKSQ